MTRILVCVLICLGQMPASAEEQMTILAMGDSTTAGTPYHLSPVEAPPNGVGEPTAPYTYWIQEAHPDWKVMNRGVNGQRADQMLGRLKKDLSAFGPDTVIILAGVNDLYQGADAETVIKRLKALYGAAGKHKVRTVACTILPYDQSDARVRSEMARVNAWIKDYAGKEGMVFCGTYKALEHPHKPGTLAGSEDTVHPDRAGYRLLGETIDRCLKKER